jgi:hypothetical protein
MESKIEFVGRTLRTQVITTRSKRIKHVRIFHSSGHCESFFFYFKDGSPAWFHTSIWNDEPAIYNSSN